jgi:hypothetical protein
MENNAGVENAALNPQEETAKAAILAECDKFAKAGGPDFRRSSF